MIKLKHCPYCRKEMILINDEYTNPKMGLVNTYFFYCVCGATSPTAASEEEATEKALNRAEPQNRVLTQEELLALSKQKDEIVWYEYDFDTASNGYKEPCYCTFEEADGKISDMVDFYVPGVETESNSIVIPSKGYGKTWRCWLRKPTDEERASVPWEV